MVKIRTKKSVSLTIVMILTVSLLVGGITYAENTGPQVRELSLQEAVDLAVENNYDIKIAQSDVKIKEISYKQADDAADDMDVENVNTFDLGVLKWVNPRGAQMELTIAQKSEEVITKSTKLSVESAYYDVLKTKKLLEIKKDTLNYAKDQLAIAQKSYKLGTVAKGDVLAVEAMVAGSEAGVTDAQNNYDMAVMELNELIGLDLHTPLKLTDKFEFKPMEEIDVNSAVYDALENNLDIVMVKEEQAVMEKQFEVAKKFYAGGVRIFDKAELAAEKSDMKVKKQEVATRKAVEQDNMTIKAIEKSIAYKKKEVEKQKEVLRITMLKYENGLATNQDVKKATIDYEEAEQGLAELIYNHNKLKSTFKYGLFNAASGAAGGGAF